MVIFKIQLPQLHEWVSPKGDHSEDTFAKTDSARNECSIAADEKHVEMMHSRVTQINGQCV